MVTSADRCGNVRAGRCECLCARRSSNTMNDGERHREHHDEIFGPKRHANRQAEQKPMPEPAAAQGAMKGKSGQRPERQLDDVVIEFGRPCN